MKKTIAIVGLFLILGLSLQAGGVRKDDAWAGIQLTAIHHTTYVGGNFELRIGHHLALGGDINIWLEGAGGLVISPDITYHFPLRVSRIDLFAGAGPSLAFGFKGGSDFRLKIFGGVRYWTTSRMAVYAKLVSEIGDNGDLGATIGVNWRL